MSALDVLRRTRRWWLGPVVVVGSLLALVLIALGAMKFVAPFVYNVG